MKLLTDSNRSNIGFESVFLNVFTYFPFDIQVCPGLVIVICPPNIHINLQLSSNAGIPVIFCFPPGNHGDVIAGTQGIGVNTPIAAEVAEATVGFANDLHMPKGITLAIGIKSITVALGLF